MSRSSTRDDTARTVALTQFRVNNFDLIRLLAALQVVYGHTAKLMGVMEDDAPIRIILERFPGVPIFFFVSGFLISRSYEMNSGLANYSRNRAFRIYPGLWVCFIVSVLAVFLAGYFNSVEVPATSFFTWTLAQFSFLQFYNPEFMRGYGTGTLNGALWTVTVELQFYVMIPILYLCLKRLSREAFNKTLIVLIVAFMLINLAFYRNPWIDFSPGVEHHISIKLFGVTFFPWFYMFLIGVWTQRNFEWARKLVQGRFFFFLIAYACMSFLMVDLLGLSLPGQDLDPLSFVVLCMLALSAAYTMPTLSGRILRRNDISYGVYIYHMPVVNFLLYFGINKTLGSQFLAIGVTIVLAIGSWVLVERPCLKLKRNSLNPLKSRWASSNKGADP